MTLSEMWPDPRLAKGAVQGGYLLEIEHPKTANAIVESFATFTSVVTRASELIKAGYRTEIWSLVSAGSTSNLQSGAISNGVIRAAREKHSRGSRPNPPAYRPAQMSGPELRIGLEGAYRNFYAASSMASRFPVRGKRHRAQWLIYNLFMRRASRTENISSVVAATAEPDVAPMPPILPVKREWRAAVLEAAGGGPGPHMS